jgi:hypothetical protein
MRRATKADRAPASAALAIALLALSGSEAARAADDTSTLTSVLSLFGAGEENNEKIVYRERSKLVLPPSGRGLPEPQAPESARPASWPVDPDARRRSGETPVGQSGAEPGEKREASVCLESALGRRCGDAGEAAPAAAARKRAAGQSSTRAFLTEPPAAFREKVAGGKGVADTEKSSDWWNPGALIGRVFGD